MMGASRGMFRLLQMPCAAALIVASGTVSANLVISNTRVIYNSPMHDVTVNIANVGLRPSLLQAWIDRGNPDTAPDEDDVPFTIVPPVARVNGGQSQTLKITWNGDPLPADRESVFYLNVMDIPPEPSGASRSDHSYIQFAIRTRIKLFFRPQGLSGRADSAARQLVWQQIGHVVRLYNPTPFHVSINQIRDSSGRVPVSSAMGMVPPFGSSEFKLAPAASPHKGGDLQIESINDYGGNSVSAIHVR